MGRSSKPMMLKSSGIRSPLSIHSVMAEIGPDIVGADNAVTPVIHPLDMVFCGIGNKIAQPDIILIDFQPVFGEGV